MGRRMSANLSHQPAFSTIKPREQPLSAHRQRQKFRRRPTWADSVEKVGVAVVALI
jgi:hypothetical protein